MKGFALHRSAHGFVVLLIILSILTIGAISLLVVLGATATNSSRRLQQNTIEGADLQAAKQALIGYMLSPPAAIGNIRPGMLPIPDSLANGLYDGKEDNQCLGNTTNGLPGVGANSTVKRCLGKFPWKALGLDIGNPAAHDPLGEVPWLSVSANLVSYDSCLSVLNSDVANLDSPGSSSCSPGTWPYPQPTVLPHPWLSVFDQNGNLLSDKVAAVLIMPGAPITTETRGQVRTPASVGNPADYLDSINLPLGCATGCTAFDNAGLNNKFVMIAPGTRYPATAANAAVRNQLVPVNDNLIYITIDELMYYIERRVVGEMASSMQIFKARGVTTGLQTYPWLQPISAATPALTDSTSLYSQPNTIFGVFPFLRNYVTGESNVPAYRTDFSWNVNSPSEATSVGGTVPACIQINAVASNNRWIKNPLAGSLNSTNPYSTSGPYKVGTANVSEGTCKWFNGSKLSCVDDLPPLAKTMTLWSSQALCNATSAVTVGSLNISISRSITLSSTLCPSTASNVTYTNASSSSVHRWNFSCSSVVGEPAIIIQDTVSTAIAGYNKLPQIVDVASDSGISHAVLVTDMRYNPIMPTWFYDNRWYLSAFAAISPTAGFAPTTSSPNPCGSATSLTLDNASGNAAIAMLSGRQFSTPPKPSNAIADYLESTNVNGGSTCSFNNFASPNASTSNDSLLSVSP